MGFKGPLQPAGTSWSHLPQRSSSGLCRLGAQVSSLDGPFSIPSTPLAPQHLLSSLSSPTSCLKPPEWPCPGEPLAPTSHHLDRPGLTFEQSVLQTKGSYVLLWEFPQETHPVFTRRDASAVSYLCSGTVPHSSQRCRDRLVLKMSSISICRKKFKKWAFFFFLHL